MNKNLNRRIAQNWFWFYVTKIMNTSHSYATSPDWQLNERRIENNRFSDRAFEMDNLSWSRFYIAKVNKYNV